MTEINRKTDIPVVGIPEIVAWLLKNCTTSELFFMANLADDKEAFGLLSRIFKKLTTYNESSVFYAKKIENADQIFMLWLSKRGEVAGLKAFQMACQAAKEVIAERERQIQYKRKQREEDEE